MKTEYIINTDKIKNIKICYISDIHSKIDRLKLILDDIIKSKIDILLIGGDTLNSAKDFSDKDKLKKILKEYSKKIDIYVGLGNHELVYYEKIIFRQEELKFNDTKYWEELGTIVNVSSFPNKKGTLTKWPLKDIDIYALNIPIEYYWDGEKKEDLKKYIKLLKDVNPKKYNILLLHSPINILENKTISKDFEVLKKYDLILCGHMHSGLVPKKIRKKFGRGLAGPYKNLFPKYSYGLVKDNDTTVLISGGVSKFSKTSIPINGFRNFLDKIYPYEIEILDFTKK